MRRDPKVDVVTLMRVLQTVEEESKDKDLTTTRLLKLTGMRSLHTLYAYVRFACANKLLRLAPVRDPRPFGVAKYYFLTRGGDRLLQAWERRLE